MMVLPWVSEWNRFPAHVMAAWRGLLAVVLCAAYSRVCFSAQLASRPPGLCPGLSSASCAEFSWLPHRFLGLSLSGGSFYCSAAMFFQVIFMAMGFI